MATPELMTLVIVDAPCGKLQGLSKAGLNAFKGVPFAEPPVGPRRWAPPSKRQAWSGIREAVHVGPAALPSRRGCCHPRPSQTRTCRFPASGSSGESFAPGDVAM